MNEFAPIAAIAARFGANGGHVPGNIVLFNARQGLESILLAQMLACATASSAAGGVHGRVEGEPTDVVSGAKGFRGHFR